MCLKSKHDWGIQNIQYEAMSSAMKIWKPVPSYGTSTLIWFNKLPVVSIFQLSLQMHSYLDSQERTKVNEYIFNYFLFCFSWDALLLPCLLPSLLYWLTRLPLGLELSLIFQTLISRLVLIHVSVIHTTDTWNSELKTTARVLFLLWWQWL